MKTTSMNYFYEILKKSIKHFIFLEILIIFRTVGLKKNRTIKKRNQ